MLLKLERKVSNQPNETDTHAITRMYIAHAIPVLSTFFQQNIWRDPLKINNFNTKTLVRITLLNPNNLASHYVL